MENNLKPLTLFLSALTWVGILGIHAVYVWMALQPGNGLTDIGDRFAGIVVQQPLAWWQSALALILSALGSAFLVIALLYIARLLRLYRQGGYFSAAAAQAVLRAGQALFAAAVASVIVYPVQTVVLTLNNADGARQLGVAVQSSDLGFVLAGGLLILIGHTLRQAAVLKAENEGFV